ncbi:MAG: magnesium transporter, partial [Bacteroidetes bacterium]|nr:magnesium transporter [Bacteroidota bacterium]
LDEEVAADVLVEIEEDDRERLLKALPSEDIAQKYLDNMDSDDAADVLADMSEQRQEEVLSKMDDMDQAGDIVDLLNYSEDSAGGIMAKEYIVVKENWTVDECIKEIRRLVEEVEEVFYVYVLNDDEVLQGILSLKTLLISPANRKAINLCEKDIISVKTDMEDEDVGKIMQKYDLVVLPVVDSLGRLVGRITIDDVVDVIRDEAEKDYQMISGISEDVEPDDRLLVQTRARLPWLIIGLVGGILGAKVIGFFKPELAQETAFVMFLPLIAAMAGNVGVQSSSIIVQGLASNSIHMSSIARRVFREMRISVVNGIILSVLMLVYNLLVGEGYLLTATVSLALFTVIIFASIFGTFVPLILNRYKVDPALATGPFITTTNDIMGLLIYLALTNMLL